MFRTNQVMAVLALLLFALGSVASAQNACGCRHAPKGHNACSCGHAATGQNACGLQHAPIAQNGCACPGAPVENPTPKSPTTVPEPGACPGTIPKAPELPGQQEKAWEGTQPAPNVSRDEARRALNAA